MKVLASLKSAKKRDKDCRLIRRKGKLIVINKKNPRLKARQGQHLNIENKEKIEAAVFRRLLNHLQENKNLQNIDLMNLAGFCRNCLSKWYVEASKENGQEINYDKAKEIIYSMPYSEWKEKYQKQFYNL